MLCTIPLLNVLDTLSRREKLTNFRLFLAGSPASSNSISHAYQSIFPPSQYHVYLKKQLPYEEPRILGRIGGTFVPCRQPLAANYAEN